MRLGRRPLFFFAVAVVAAMLYPATDAEFRFVNVFMIGLSSFWAVLLALEELAGRGRGERGTGL
jgi:hypothetical protein